MQQGPAMMLRLSWARLSSFCGRYDAQGTTKNCSVRVTQRITPRVIQRGVPFGALATACRRVCGVGARTRPQEVVLLPRMKRQSPASGINKIKPNFFSAMSPAFAANFPAMKPPMPTAATVWLVALDRERNRFV
ncbi:hypothetical protein [Mesorhizobium sp. B2-4-19]|uniref:hypothetical protein n=1 Tax=Mesorhizobium sp. B2-4-19 TaxID=2589930 RepID=UPI0015E2B9B8|nr:hypothetical protein [Mesorhizobium sp. B2-4-19]